MTVFKLEELFHRLCDGHLMVTGNSRLARVIGGQYSQWQQKRGERQWASPALLSWQAWLDRLWEEATLAGADGTAPAVPSGRQLNSLWEQVLAQAENTANLLRPESLAEQARETRRLAVEWQVDFNDPAWRSDGELDNEKAFQEWNRSFERLCRTENWLPPEDRGAVLIRAIQAGGLLPGQPVDLLGFDEFTPIQASLLKSLEHEGAVITAVSLEAAPGSAGLWQSRNAQDELQHMARWVRHHYENDPESRIAVIVPELGVRRAEVERHLEEVLTPGPRRARAHWKPWNVSLGASLGSEPLIRSAFDVLDLLGPRVDIQTVGRVLRSPWIRGGVSERYQRALLEKCLREHYPRQVSLGEITYRAGEIRKHDRRRRPVPELEWEARPWQCPILKRLLNNVEAFARDRRQPNTPSGWADAFERLLTRMGWPRKPEQEIAVLTPAEHDRNWQAYQHWQDALRELASLDATVGRMSREKAIAQLRRICLEQVFQPRTAPAAIQVMGLYEAVGLRFDHLWVLGLHNDNWPPPARPNPFIPAVLQRQAGLPHSTPQRELEVARTITRRLLQAAPDTVFSYPGQADGEAVLPSPLLLAEGLTSAEQVPAWPGESWRDTVYRSGGIRNCRLNMPGPLERDTAHGGTSILRHQALCPFRAFASNRLGADGLESPVDGISPMLHGSLLHAVLERFWRETLDQDTLLNLAPQALEDRLRLHIDAVLDEERGLRYRPAFREVEAGRLLRLALKSLELDKARGPFEVEGFEMEVLHEIETQQLRLFIDRLDRLPGGGMAVIDYKTGRVDPKKWFGDRPEDPQLPLYAISSETPPDAIVFAVIRDDDCVYSGVVNQEGLFPGLPPRRARNTEMLIEAGEDLPATITEWRSILHRLMREFLGGQAEVDPKDGSNTCEKSFCELHKLCRIDELEHLAGLDRASGAEAET
jgi:probable DNA repair protein